MGKRSRKATGDTTPRGPRPEVATKAPSLKQRASASWAVGGELSPKSAVGTGKRARSEPGAAASRAAARSGVQTAGSRRGARERPERPASMFWGPLPVAELIMVLGAVLLFVGVSRGQDFTSTIVRAGAGLVFVGGLELTAREHLAGFKPHSIFLAGLAVLALTAILAAVGGADAARHPLAVAAYAAVFGVLATTLKNTYTGAPRGSVRRR